MLKLTNYVNCRLSVGGQGRQYWAARLSLESVSRVKFAQGREHKLRHQRTQRSELKYCSVLHDRLNVRRTKWELSRSIMNHSFHYTPNLKKTHIQLTLKSSNDTTLFVSHLDQGAPELDLPLEPLSGDVDRHDLGREAP